MGRAYLHCVFPAGNLALTNSEGVWLDPEEGFQLGWTLCFVVDFPLAHVTSLPASPFSSWFLCSTPHPLPSVPVQKWTFLTRQHAKLSVTQEAVMTNSSNVESGKRTCALLLRRGNERSADFRSRTRMSFLPRWTSRSLKPGGHGLLVFVMPEPVILKDIRFPENTQIYLWRIREGFPTQSEAWG